MEAKAIAELKELFEELFKICPIILPLVREIIVKRKHPISLPVIVPIEEKVLTSEQAAKFLKITAHTLNVLTKSESLKCRYIGKEKRYLLSELLVYLKRKPLNQID